MDDKEFKERVVKSLESLPNIDQKKLKRNIFLLVGGGIGLTFALAIIFTLMI